MTFLLALALAVVTALLQSTLSAMSRPPKKQGDRFWDNYEKEDWVLWSDWVVAGAIAAVSFVLREVLAGKPFEAGRFIPTLCILVFVPLLAPPLLGAFLYERNSGALRPGPTRIIFADLAGLGILIGLVFGGARIG